MLTRVVAPLAPKRIRSASLIAALNLVGCASLDARVSGQSVGAKVLTKGSPAAASAQREVAGASASTSTPIPTVVPSSVEPPTLDEPAALVATTSISSDPMDGDRSYLQPIGDAITHRRAPATRFANLAAAACRDELRRRHLAVVPARGAAQGIAVPVRITGPLRGVRFVTPGQKSVHGMLDCRLLLLLDEVSAVLVEHGVTTVYVDGFYRPKAHLPGKKAPSQHAFGLAVDIHGFGMADGRTLQIERDFAGELGRPVCGESAWLSPSSRDSVTLRNVVCALARAKSFHYLLTPNYDAAHVNHIHGDIKRGAREHIVR